MPMHNRQPPPVRPRTGTGTTAARLAEREREWRGPPEYDGRAAAPGGELRRARVHVRMGMVRAVARGAVGAGVWEL